MKIPVRGGKHEANGDSQNALFIRNDFVQRAESAWKGRHEANYDIRVIAFKQISKMQERLLMVAPLHARLNWWRQRLEKVGISFNPMETRR